MPTNPRTTNAVEGWHRVFQHTVGYTHPTNYKLIESIQLERYYSRNMKTKIDAEQYVVKNSKMYLCLCWSTKIASKFPSSRSNGLLEKYFVYYRSESIVRKLCIFCLFYFRKLAAIHQFKKKLTEKC